LKGLELYANEVHEKFVDPEVPEIKGFYDVWAMHTSSNKLFNGLHKAQQKAMDRAHIDRKDLITVYVGDSTGDFHCLLAADVGICVRDEHSPVRSGQIELTDTFKRVGVEVRPLSDLKQICSEMDFEESQAAAQELAQELFKEAQQKPFLFEGDEMLPENAAPTEAYKRIAALRVKAKQGPAWRGVYWTDDLREIADLMEHILKLAPKGPKKQSNTPQDEEDATDPEELKRQKLLERKEIKEARRTFHCHHDGCVYAPDGMKKGFSSQYNLDRHLKGAHSAR
jgi:hypothetical protein